MTWLRANVGVIALSLSLLGSGIAGYVRVHDLEAQVAAAVDQNTAQDKDISALKALPGAIDSLAFSARLQSLWFTCVQIQRLSEDRCRQFYFQVLQTGVFPDWASIGPPDSTSN